MPPPTRYVIADGARIAYQVYGHRPPTLVASAGSFSHTDVIWEDPAASLFYSQLGSFSEVVRYDRLGTSNSDPFPPGWDPTLVGYTKELEAVLSAVDAGRVALLAMLDAGPAALRFAADHADRVSRLILYNATARFVAADDYPIGLAPEAMNAITTMIKQTWGTDAQVALNVPSRVGDAAFTAWYGKYVRAIGTPTTMTETLERVVNLDAREVLSSIEIPTLVIHRADYGLVPASHGRYLADHIPDATYVEVPGADGPAFWETPDRIVAAIRDFLGDEAGDYRPDAEMATVLFTDIVGSTEQLRAVGDRQWSAFLRVHDDIAARFVAGYGGRLIKTTGDGILATFPDPVRAVDCARALARQLHEMGIVIRAGIHTGRIERSVDDVGGLAVHIAARVMATGGDGLVVSRTVRDLLLGSDHRFESIGSHSLKGVDGTWELFRSV